MKRLLILLMSMVFLSAQPYALAQKNAHATKRGQAAIDFLGETRINEHANRLKMKPEKLKGILLNDSTLAADTSGELLYIDPVPENLLVPDSEDGTLLDNSIPLTDVFLLHSKPGAAKVIFLDFDGALVQNTSWNIRHC